MQLSKKILCCHVVHLMNLIIMLALFQIQTRAQDLFPIIFRAMSEAYILFE
jgi:hypothetical protein